MWPSDRVSEVGGRGRVGGRTGVGANEGGEWSPLLVNKEVSESIKSNEETLLNHVGLRNNTHIYLARMFCKDNLTSKF